MIPDISSGGGAITPSASSGASSGDVLSETIAKQGGLTINKGLTVPDWVKGVAAIGLTIVGGIYAWKKTK